MEAEIAKLQDEIEVEKRKTRVIETYKLVCTDGSVSTLACLTLLERCWNERHRPEAQWICEV